jgi:homoserine dehydrogenase
MSAVSVGIIGLGTVGTGVAKLLLERRAEIAQRTGVDLALVAAADLKPERAAALNLSKDVYTPDASALLARQDIDIIVELIGGLEPARSFITKALSRGQSVVTANKHLLAESFYELSKLAVSGGSALFFEASVAGGIPLLKSVREGLAANRVKSFLGIVNGTCNYILTEMNERGIDFSSALRGAKEQGFAEADPTLDIEGHDSAHKLVVLAALAFGRVFPLNGVYTEGISKIKPEDIRYAAEMGYIVKLLAIGRNSEKGFELRVHPVLLERHHPLASVSGSFNAVMIEADAAGRLMFYGRGAGQMPTASAVVADIIDAARWRRMPADSSGGNVAVPARGSVLSMDETNSHYFIRFNVADQFGVLGRIATELGHNRVSIQMVIQKEKRPDGIVPVVILTHPAREADFRKAISAIDSCDFVLEATSFIRAIVD